MKKYEKEFKDQVADAFLTTTDSLGVVAKKFGVSPASVRHWARFKNPFLYEKAKSHVGGSNLDKEKRKHQLLTAQQIVEERPDIRIKELADMLNTTVMDIRVWQEYGYLELDYKCPVCEKDTNTKYCSSCVAKGYDRYHRLYNMTIRECENLPTSCEICGSTENLHVDHDHTTERYRGVLCRGCNVSLGMIYEDVNRLQKMIEYINKNK